jgi:hypothetical protein
MTYKTAWYVAHRIREAMREARDIQLGDPDTTVEIDEAYIGGRLRHKGSTVAKASKTMVIGLAERNWRVHLESMSNRKFEAINPVLDAKLAEVGLIAWDTKGKSVNWEEGTQQMMLKPDVYAAIQKSGIPRMWRSICRTPICTSNWAWLMEHRARRERWKSHCIRSQLLQRRRSNPRPIDAVSESASRTYGGKPKLSFRQHLSGPGDSD